MAKTLSQKNTELLLSQQKTELDKLRSSLPLDALRAAEDKLLKQCIETVEGLLDFSALGYTDKGELDEESIPFEWGILTPEEKARKIRLAKYGCLPSADIPHGAKLAHTTLIGIIKSRAVEKSGTKHIHLEAWSQFPAPAPLTQDKDAIDADYEVLDID
jgi:hypothetical protein